MIPGGIEFAYPWMLAFPLLLLGVRILRRPRQSAILFPETKLLEGVNPGLRAKLRTPVLGMLSALLVTALAVAAARPQKITPVPNTTAARNLLLALDVSRSMEAPDFGGSRERITRMSGVKAVVQQFIEERPGDQIGLVVFGSRAFVQSPLTLDHGVLRELVSRLYEGIAGDGTAIGDGLGLSLKRVHEVPAESRAVILLTDGVNNSGSVNPLKAARVAADLGIKVHTIGIGSDQPVALGNQGFFGTLQTRAEFDEKTLREIAEITGGVYFNARDIEGLKQVYSRIDELEKAEAKDHAVKTEELFVAPALTAAAAFLLFVLLSRTFFLKLP